MMHVAKLVHIVDLFIESALVISLQPALRCRSVALVQRLAHELASVPCSWRWHRASNLLAVGEPSRTHLAAQRGTSSMVDPAGLRDLALIAGMSSLPDGDSDWATESSTQIGRPQEATELETTVVDSVFQGIGG